MKSHVLRAVLAGFFAIPVSAGVAQAATFVVHDTGNSSDSSVGNGVCRTSVGVCTLRAAVQEANANAALDTIAFAIGSGPRRISLSSNLPTITQPVVIDGWTQPGFDGTPLIEIRGTSSLGDGIKISAGGCTVRGLVINSFGGDGVFVSGPGGNVFEGNYIGLNANGDGALGNAQTGIRIEAPNNRIGGRQVAQRNVISGNTGRDILAGVMIYGPLATGNVVQGNFIGLDATGMFAIGNHARGVTVHDAPGNYIGGVEEGAGNLIAGNRATGVRLWGNADGNYVLGNWVGVNKLRETRIGLFPEPGILSNARGVQMRSDNNIVAYNYIAGNTYEGVLFYDGFGKDFNPEATASNNLVYGNTITNNGMTFPGGPDGPGGGILVGFGTGNRFIANSIYDHQSIGINLQYRGFDGVDPNDFLDLDTGGNNRQNFPGLSVSSQAGGRTTVWGGLDSAPNGTFLVQIFASPACHPSGFGEGQYFVGSTNVTTSATGQSTFNVALPYLIPVGWVLTSTATAASGDTSEFSACLVVK
jgi:Right handed beta helix region